MVKSALPTFHYTVVVPMGWGIEKARAALKGVGVAGGCFNTAWPHATIQKTPYLKKASETNALNHC